jgi:hypothetical protein
MLESTFKYEVRKKIEKMFPGIICTRTDPTQIQGFPDMLLLYGDKWAALEFKKDINSTLRPNQQYYIDMLNELSYASIIHPQNMDEVLNDIQKKFST